MGNDNKSIIEMLNLGAVKGDLVRSGVCTPNEAREAMGLPRYEGTDNFHKTLILDDFGSLDKTHERTIECQWCGRVMTDDWKGEPCPGCAGRVR